MKGTKCINYEPKEEKWAYTDSLPKKIEDSIIKMNHHKHLTKDQKYFIIDCLIKYKMSISKVADQLMMGYSTVYQIKKDFEWDTNHGTNPFSNIRENKRLSKLLKKVINNYISSQKDSFTIGDIRKAIISESNEEIKNHIIRKYLKETLNMSYRRCTNKSTNVDVPKLSILRMLFSFRIGKHINESTLMISVDETTFNHKVVNNKSWIIKGYSAELFNSKFVGSCSLIMAITSRGSYFGLITNRRIDSNIYLKY